MQSYMYFIHSHALCCCSLQSHPRVFVALLGCVFVAVCVCVCCWRVRGEGEIHGSKAGRHFYGQPSKAALWFFSLQLAPSSLSFGPPLVAQMITARLQTGGTWSEDSFCLISDSPTFLPDKHIHIIWTHTHTHTHICLYNGIFANAHADIHISLTHMPVHKDANTRAHTQMQARIRGSHGGWCAALCSRIGSSASCELDSPGSVLIPATLFTSPHMRTHTLQSRPQPSRGLY